MKTNVISFPRTVDHLNNEMKQLLEQSKELKQRSDILRKEYERLYLRTRELVSDSN